MSKEYSQQQLTQFFNQFKKLENSYPIEKVHQIINNPNAMARYRVKHVKPLKIIIMTFLISLSAVLALWFLAPDTKKNINTEQDFPVNKQEVAITENRDQSDVKASDVKMATAAEINQDENVYPTESVDNSAQQPVVEKQKELVLTDPVIDGSRFILELTNEELRKLGFNINHYTILYSNNFKEKNILYLSANPRFLVQAFINRSRESRRLSEYYPLKRYNPDTIANFFQLLSYRTAYSPNPNTIKSRKIDYEPSQNDYFPLFVSNIDGTIHSIDEQLNFEECKDTLIPVVVRFSQLESAIKTDQLFWFKTTNKFYQSLPDRYSWLKEEFESIKQLKESDPKLEVNHHVDRWIEKQLFSPEKVVDGTTIRLKLTIEELKKIGIHKNSNGIKYNYQTLIGDGKAFGGHFNVDLDHLNDSMMVNVDFIPKYMTDKYGELTKYDRKSKELDLFLTDNDILLPIISDEFYNNMIYWFSISDSLWTLLPERYQYLKQDYNRIMFNKSIRPDKDWVKYFKEDIKRIVSNVNLIDLDKNELENLGFIFNGDTLSLDCAYGNNWIKYSCRYNSSWFKATHGGRPESVTQQLKELAIQPSVNYITPSERFVDQQIADKFDSLYENANQGFQFVYITDLLGRQLHKIDILPENIYVNGKDFEFLIPVLVQQNEYFNELTENKIFWFTPTEAFFDRLPERIKNELRKEYEMVSSEGKSSELSACTYFETCRSTLKVENMKIYPNPAKREITIDFSLKNALSGEILLANIMGQQVKVLRPKSTFNEGANSVICELNGIKPGIYLVSIVTPLGFKTERLIVTE